METENWDTCSSDSEISQQDLRDEEESFYASGSVSKLQFRKASSKAHWDSEKGMAEVVERKGQIWTTTGIIRSGKLYCSIEETLFLMEIGALLLIGENDACLALHNIYQKLAEEKSGCNWELYEVYRHMKSLGYIVGRHGVPWTFKSLKANGNPVASQGTSDLIEEQRCTESIAEKLNKMDLNGMRPIFDIYLPNGKFKKSSPGEPCGILCLAREYPPSKPEVEALERKTGDIPLKFCQVENGRVSFFSFENEDVPVLP